MQKFKEKLVYTSILILIFIFLCPPSIITAAPVIHSKSLSQGKSMLIGGPFSKSKDIKWHSNNANIASVDSRGIVYAKSVGNVEISAVNNSNNQIYKCKINIFPSEPVRSVFTNCPFPTNKDRFSIFAFTPQNVSSVKITLEGPNYKHEVHKESKYKSNEFYLWEEKISPLKPGSYSITVLSNIDGKWKSCPNSYMRFDVESNYSKSELSKSKRSLSKEGANFIAHHEGFNPKAYWDMAGVLTIGYGKIIYPYTPFYNNQGKNEAYQDFLNHLDHSNFLASVNNMLTSNGIKFNQYQFDALVSFTYNLGKNWTKSSYLRNLIINCGKKAHLITGKVNSTNGLNLRQNPSEHSKKLLALNNQSEVIVLSTNKVNNSWYKVKTLSGIIGYCFEKYLEIRNTSPEPKNLNCIDKEEFASEFLYYHHIKNKCIKGLLLRRLRELKIFFEGNYSGAVNYNNYPIPRCAKNLI